MKICGYRCWRIIAVLLLLASYAALAEAGVDGPYVWPDGKNKWIAQWHVRGNGEPQIKREPVSKQIVVPGVAGMPGFHVRLRQPSANAPEQITLATSTPLFVVADTHGEYEILAELLQKQKVVNAKMRWSFGDGHLVFLGDVFDRGAHQVEILWWIYQLEAEAAKAGGGVHLLLGNHESMVLRGDVRYLNPKYLETANALGVVSYSELFGPATLLGQWLRTKPAVLKLNNLLLLHGGISPELVERGLELATINRTVRDVLTGATSPEQALPKFVMGPSGPLWYRGYFPMKEAPPSATQTDVEAALYHFGVELILVGHTVVPTVTSLYNGKVIAVQVYPHRDEHSGAAVAEGVVLEKGQWYRARIDGTRELLLPGRLTRNLIKTGLQEVSATHRVQP